MKFLKSIYTAAKTFVVEKSKQVVTFVVGTSMSALVMAQTTDPGVQAIEGLSAKATTYIAAAFAVAVLVAGGFWGISMMKKAFSRAK